ncbi:aldehyde dehydrogenase (NAD(P)+) [Nakamurella sp. UYEF19]|uniref:aldehyde dehydrogenase family protein n=1 Tax=Nakamurella sp. UYEF19 TaxID=1756392 RepID=UPI00339B6944
MTAQIFEQNVELINGSLAELTAGARRWTGLTVEARRELLEAVSRSVAAEASNWVSVACGYKGLEPGSPLVGEEWTSGPYAVLSGLSALVESLRALETGKSPVDGVTLGTAPGGRVTVEALPHNIFDVLLLNGFSAQVWMKPGVTAQQVVETAGLGQLTPTVGGGVGVVLGAGNISSIPPLDVLYELIAHNRVSILKLNPVTDPLLPVFEKAFAPLIQAGYLRVVIGAADIGQHLVHHSSVDHVHITGSAASHNSIVFGGGVDGEARRAAVRQGAAEPLLDKEITSELGGVSPIIVVPGRWSKADLKYQAEHVATQRLHNGGYNCIAGQVLLVSSDWDQREDFLEQVRLAMAKAPARPAFYPGSDQRVASARLSYPDAVAVDRGRLIVRAGSVQGEKALNVEYFAPVLAVKELPGAGLAFFRAAVSAANDEFVGTLGVSVIAHPRTLRAAGEAFELALADLRYGAIGVNVWTGFGFLAARATWGAFPGHTLTEVGSGVGIVHNALLLDGAERTVIRGPFRPSHRALGAGEFTLSPKPPWFVGNRTQATTGRRLTAFAAKPGWARLPGIFASALRG